MMSNSAVFLIQPVSCANTVHLLYKKHLYCVNDHITKLIDVY